MRILYFVLVLFLVIAHKHVYSQAVEFYAGNKRTGVDILWFKYIENKTQQKSPFLYFSRNRASTDYENSPTIFASTNAISYNLKNGLGIVLVGSFLNAGFTPKMGVQFIKQKKDFLIFGWLVADIANKGNIDLFALFRYQPKINERCSMFGQIELFPIYNPSDPFLNFSQRIRLGLKYSKFTGGVMTDFNQTGWNSFSTTSNLGGFLRIVL
ncbi:MAG: hypothetical protein K2X37_07505 [Chitinophagaceae bacterium]|nr:hypothetical protein [Chitinophagaceae bacterium]